MIVYHTIHWGTGNQLWSSLCLWAHNAPGPSQLQLDASCIGIALISKLSVVILCWVTISFQDSTHWGVAQGHASSLLAHGSLSLSTQVHCVCMHLAQFRLYVQWTQEMIEMLFRRKHHFLLAVWGDVFLVASLNSFPLQPLFPESLMCSLGTLCCCWHPAPGTVPATLEPQRMI